MKGGDHLAIIKQHDKRSGITYVYESHSYWDPEKKMTRARRKLIGRLNPETGEIVPTDGRNRKAAAKKKAAADSEKNPDYEELCRSLQQKCDAQEELIRTLEKEIRRLKNGE